MPEILFFGEVTFIILGIVGIIAYLERRWKRRTVSLRSVTGAYEGRLISTRPGVRWRMEFKVDGVDGEACAGTADGGDRNKMWVHFSWRSPGRLHLARDGVLARIGNWLDGQDIQVGDIGFDQTFWIFGKPESWVREVLDPETRGRIWKRADRKPPEIRIDIGSEGVRIGAPRDLAESEAELREFIDTSIAILRRCRLVSEGLATLPPVEEVVAAGRCPVCAQPLAEPLRRCGRCKTAHHRECWEYFGTCAIYGCARGRGPSVPSEPKRA